MAIFSHTYGKLSHVACCFNIPIHQLTGDWTAAFIPRRKWSHLFDYFTLGSNSSVLGKKTSLKARLAECFSVTLSKPVCQGIASFHTATFVADGRFPWGLKMTGFHNVTGWQPDPAQSWCVLGAKVIPPCATVKACCNQQCSHKVRRKHFFFLPTTKLHWSANVNPRVSQSIRRSKRHEVLESILVL